MDFDLYYFIPWPKCQKIQDSLSRDFWSFTDPEFPAGIFIDKNWFDKNKKIHGL